MTQNIKMDEADKSGRCQNMSNICYNDCLQKAAVIIWQHRNSPLCF